MATEYKVVLLGDAKSGKTTWVNRLLSGSFTKEYVPTTGAVTSAYTTYVNDGIHAPREVVFQLWDVSGDEERDVLGEAYYVGAAGAILFIDGALSSKERRESQKRWTRRFRLVSSAPLEVVTTKCDAYPSPMKGSTSTSSKSNYNYVTALQRLVRTLTGRSNVYLNEDPTCRSVPEVTLSIATLREYEGMLRAITATV
jgi:GTP-binding nuclear protein Ran